MQERLLQETHLLVFQLKYMESNNHMSRMYTTKTTGVIFAGDVE